MSLRRKDETRDLSRWGAGLRAARDRSRLSQEAAAEAVGLNRVVLSYYETGERQPAVTTLVSLANLYGVSLQDLLAEAETESRVPPSEILFRAAPQTIADRPRAQLFRFFAYVDAYLELLGDMGGTAPGRQVSPFAQATPRAGRREAVRRARMLREFFGLGMGPIGDLFRVIDEHVLVFRLPLGAGGTDGPSGLSYNHPKAGFCIVVNSDMTLSRQVFTLAHELAHTYFHSQASDAWISMEGAPIARERFADFFAGEFLVPGDTLARMVEELEAWEEVSEPAFVVHLRHHFGVSYAAIVVRLFQEKFISESEYKRLREISPSGMSEAMGYPLHPADLGDYKLRPLDRFPDRMLRLVRTAVNKKVITRGDAAETLGVSLEDATRLLGSPKAGEAERRAISDLEEVAHLD